MDSPLVAELLRLAAVVGSAAPCDELQDARDELEELLSDYECGAVTRDEADGVFDQCRAGHAD